MSYNILNKNVNFQGATKGTVEDLVDTHANQAISGSKDFNVLTGSNTHVVNTISVATHAVDHAVSIAGAVSASLNISASAFYADGVLVGGGGAVSSVANGVNNRIATFSSANALNGEANLTFNGTVLDFKATSISGSGNISGSQFIGTWAGANINGSQIQLASNGGIDNSSGLRANPSSMAAVSSLAGGDSVAIYSTADSAPKKTTVAGINALAAISSFSNGVDNRVITATGGSSLNGEANLTFDGSKLTVAGNVSGSGYVSASLGWFGTKVTAGSIELGDAAGIAGAGLINNGGELDVQVSGALKIASDKIGITGSFADLGLSYQGGVNSISSIKFDPNSLSAASIAVANDSIVIIDADDSQPKKESFADVVTTMKGNGLTATSGILAVGAGTGIDVNTNDISVDVSDFLANGANNRIVTATGTDAMNGEANFTFDGTTLILTGSTEFSGSATLFDTTQFIVQSATSTKPTIQLKNTTPSDSNAGVIMDFHKEPSDNVGESDNGTIGGIRFYSLDSGNNSTNYAQMTVHSSDKSNADEGGEFRFYVMAGGTGGTAAMSEIFSIGGEDAGSGGSEPCEVVVNDAGIDCNFRVESDTNTKAFFIDGASGDIGLGSQNESGTFMFISGSNDELLYQVKQKGNGYPTMFLAGEDHASYAGIFYNRDIFVNAGAISQGNIPGANGSHTRLTVRKTSISDNSATNVVTFTVPNANHAASVRVTGLANFDGCAYARVFSFEGVIARASGSPTDKAFSSVSTTEVASITPNFSVAVAGSSNTGANSAQQTFTMQLTIDTSDSSTSNATFMIELINFNDSGITMAAS